MSFERPETPEDEAAQAEAFFKTLGPVLLTQGFESVVTATREVETGQFVPAILIRYEGRINGTPEMATSTVMMSPDDVESMVQMLAEQALMARNAPMPEPGDGPWTEGGAIEE